MNTMDVPHAHSDSERPKKPDLTTYHRIRKHIIALFTAGVLMWSAQEVQDRAQRADQIDLLPTPQTFQLAVDDPDFDFTSQTTCWVRNPKDLAIPVGKLTSQDVRQVVIKVLTDENNIPANAVVIPVDQNGNPLPGSQEIVPIHELLTAASE